MGNKMEKIIKICNTYSIEEILRNNENEMSEENREKIYLSFILKHELKNGHIVKAFRKNEKSIKHDFFQWTQCKNPDYNKYYIKLLADLHEHINQYAEVYAMLKDKVSKNIFEDICEWRLKRRADYLADAYYKSGKVQYIEEFEYLSQNEVFVDCGAFDGDSFRELIQVVGGVSKAYLYEADVKNISLAKEKLKSYSNIEYRNVGVGARREILKFQNQGLSSSAFGDCDKGIEMQVVSLDDDIKERITFLKMDIEGMEMEALLGAQRHIKEDRAVLAICVYHRVDDLWKIPLYIRDLVGNDYNFYVRHYTLYHGETVFYAVPIERK